MNLFFVFLGGGLGAALRYVSTQFIEGFKLDFPLGTLFVNAAGSLLAGFFYHAFAARLMPMEWRLFIFTGFLGGYTTFSAYSLETLKLFMHENYRQALLNILMNNVFSIVCVLIGIIIGKTALK